MAPEYHSSNCIHHWCEHCTKTLHSSMLQWVVGKQSRKNVRCYYYYFKIYYLLLAIYCYFIIICFLYIYILAIVRITHSSLDEKIATGSLLRALHVFPWPKIARYCSILASQGNKYWVVHLNSHAKVVYRAMQHVLRWDGSKLVSVAFSHLTYKWRFNSRPFRPSSNFLWDSLYVSLVGFW